MVWLRRYQFRGMFSALMIVTFIASQALSCCLVNHRVGQFLVAAFSQHAAKAADHSCCPKPVSSDKTKPASKPGSCCIQDANQKVPRLAAAEMDLPSLEGPVTASLVPASNSPSLSSLIAPRSASGPPVYLATLRLLL